MEATDLRSASRICPWTSSLQYLYINDLLLSLNNTDVCNYADDTTLFYCDIDTDNVVARLELDSAHAIKWFSDNYMKLNEDKCHLLTFGNIVKFYGHSSQT